MGYSRWNASDWNSYSTSTKTKTTDKIFSSRGMHKDLNPSVLVALINSIL